MKKFKYKLQIMKDGVWEDYTDVPTDSLDVVEIAMHAEQEWDRENVSDVYAYRIIPV